ncbi:hypothetical protein NHQ30_004070 [Ciborinia camelliae]|nr:hypothetical protein NHQ30_004070 [Ciborinia camelliae]
MNSWSPKTATYFAWALPRQAFVQPAKDPPFLSDYSVPVNPLRRFQMCPQRVFIVDSRHQCYLVEGKTFRQPWLSGCGSAILPVGMRPKGGFEGMRVWGFDPLEYWQSSSDEAKIPQFRKPRGASKKRVSFEGQSGRWSIHQVRPFEKTFEDDENASSSSLFLPLDEAVFIQPNSDDRFELSAMRRCGSCSEYYEVANPTSYTRMPDRPDYEIRAEAFSCSNAGCAVVESDGATDFADELLYGPNAIGPLNRWSDVQRWAMKQQYVEPIDLAVETVEATRLGDEPEELVGNSEEVVVPLMDSDCSSGPEPDFKLVGSTLFIPSMNGENLKSFSWADDSDEDW